ncbi:MAG: TetR/AcrR family transcriptional regulator, partial [Pseudomonadota bacterium]|nr:TetR/AcrR family transcriptional regulator [Pseudomonadota bacterium]
MSITETRLTQAGPTPRRRLTREARGRQLLDVAWQLVREEGTDALTLGRLAEQAGITKPVVYDHFTTRSGLLAALYQDFDARQTLLMDEALAQCEPTLAHTARLIAACYVDCVLLQGNE